MAQNVHPTLKSARSSGSYYFYYTIHIVDLSHRNLNFNFGCLYMGRIASEVPNGWRYPLVGETRERQFDGTNLKPHKRLENAQTPTSRVHAVLGGANFGSGRI